MQRDPTRIGEGKLEAFKGKRRRKVQFGHGRGRKVSGFGLTGACISTPGKGWNIDLKKGGNRLWVFLRNIKFIALRGPFGSSRFVEQVLCMRKIKTCSSAGPR